ncbi:hypothetical protein ACEWY4_017483 [Coilia grayii]|uniref:SAM domain-containing protein n=1 Tax=Coilia grayii TaxID=363190 RepID=A0ABD1JI32_9TELE
MGGVGAAVMGGVGTAVMGGVGPSTQQYLRIQLRPLAPTSVAMLLATVLSQSAKAKEHLLEQGSAATQPPAGVCVPARERQFVDPLLQRKEEASSESKNTEAVIDWLSGFQLQFYTTNFLTAGYDLTTISHMTTEDLVAIGVSKPGHRKKILSEISRMSVSDCTPDKPASLSEWLSVIGLGQHYQTLVQNGYDNMDFIRDITAGDMQEIGITKLGHQKKILLGVRRLVEPSKELHLSQSAASPDQPIRSPPPVDKLSNSPSPRLRRTNAPPPLTKPLPPHRSPPLTAPHTHTHSYTHTPPDIHTNSHTHTPPESQPDSPTTTHTLSHTHTLLQTHTHPPAVPQLCLPEEADTAPPGGHRVTRSSSAALDQSQASVSCSQSQAFATRPRRKTRPPTPPKRSCSSVSHSNLAEEAGPGVGLLSVSYRERRRSDCGLVSREGGVALSAAGGSVRDIAAMLEMTSPLGGGASAGGCSYLQVSPESVWREQENVTLDDLQERRRTISGPPAGLVDIATTGGAGPTGAQPLIGHLDVDKSSVSHVDAMATMRRACPSPLANESDTSTVLRRPKLRPHAEQQPITADPSDTQSAQEPISAFDIRESTNGHTGGQRRPASEVRLEDESPNFRSLPRTPKPPVSPKPAPSSPHAHPHHNPPTPVRRVLLTTSDTEVRRVPPPVAPKPSKTKITAHTATAGLHGNANITAHSTTAGFHGDGKIPADTATAGLHGNANITAHSTTAGFHGDGKVPGHASTADLHGDATITTHSAPAGFHGDAGSSTAAAPRDTTPPPPDTAPPPPALSPSPSPAQTPSPQTPHPVKPPRASIAGLSVDLPAPLEVELGGVEAVQQRLREVEQQRQAEERKLREMERHRREEERKLRELERQRAEEEERRRREREEHERGKTGGSLEGRVGVVRRRRVGVARQEQVQGELEGVGPVAMEMATKEEPVSMQAAKKEEPVAMESSMRPVAAQRRLSGASQQAAPAAGTCPSRSGPAGEQPVGQPVEGAPPVISQRLDDTSTSLAVVLQAVENKITHDADNSAEKKPSSSILDDIGSMFDDLADQLDAMLD